MVVSCYVGSGNQTWVLYKSSKCSYLLSHLSSPHSFFLKGVSLCSPTSPGDHKSPPHLGSWPAQSYPADFVTGINSKILVKNQLFPKVLPSFYYLVLMWDTLLYAVNVFYYHCLIMKPIWPIARQNRSRWEIQAKMKGKRRWVREMPAAAREENCEVTSHKPHGIIFYNKRNGLKVVRAS